MKAFGKCRICNNTGYYKASKKFFYCIKCMDKINIAAREIVMEYGVKPNEASFSEE